VPKWQEYRGIGLVLMPCQSDLSGAVIFDSIFVIGTGNGTNGFAAGILEVIDFFWQAAQASFN
jgi:hypothetical protein